MFVILDIEYARLGLIRVDAFDQALLDLRESMNRDLPATAMTSANPSMWNRLRILLPAIGLDPRGEVVAKRLAQRRLGVGGERVEPQVGGADVVGFLDDRLSACRIVRSRPRR